MAALILRLETVGLLGLLLNSPLASRPVMPEEIVVDHRCTDVSRIPDAWIETVKSQIKIHYAHTSHGGQLTSGMERLINQALPGYDSRLIYTVQLSSLPVAPDLCMMDGQLTETYIIPELYWRDDGPTYTEAALGAFPAINISMWSWCRQLDEASESYVEDYLSSVSELEQAHPGVVFIYMTGNAQATGAQGYNRHLRNEQIRKYCRENKKVLFDFADLDAWHDGQEAGYDFAGQRIPVENPVYHGDECMHTTYASCENKGKALWWLLARIAGWKPSDCDSNGDGVIDKKDLLTKRIERLQEFERWVHDCWMPRDPCADSNGDGVINFDDRVHKLRSLWEDLMFWAQQCGFSAAASAQKKEKNRTEQSARSREER